MEYSDGSEWLQENSLKTCRSGNHKEKDCGLHTNICHSHSGDEIDLNHKVHKCITNRSSISCRVKPVMNRNWREQKPVFSRKPLQPQRSCIRNVIKTAFMNGN